jgi:hypothetical protein
MRMLYPDDEPFEDVVKLEAGDLLIVIRAEEGLIAERVIGALIQAGPSPEFLMYLEKVYHRMRFTHTKEEEQ